jgi:hypothetical protein
MTLRAQGDNPIYERLTQGDETRARTSPIRYMSTGEDSLSGWAETNSQKFTCRPGASHTFGKDGLAGQRAIVTDSAQSESAPSSRADIFG